MEKYEWRKVEKELYLPKNKPTVLNVPKMKFFTISGEGNPNGSKDFQDKISVLYLLSYIVKMMPRNGFTPQDYFEYTVYPLEGIWSFNEIGQESSTFDKNNLVYKLMIRQPDFVDNSVFQKALETAKRKNPDTLYDNVFFEDIEDGLCVQMLHVGSFDNEIESFKQIKLFMENSDYQIKSPTHREIYLSDFRKTETKNLQTVFRCFIENK
ncbi:MAG: GyrI-like domain-containing protein [Dysgonamonadaceae bacterium]|jgi:hypothetical protein|nr:GyrI-like domain-containing protein [Dysgonamonadaceae bacterium]